MKKLLREYIKDSISISENDMEFLLSFFKPIFLDKGDFLFTNETICYQITFVNSGIVRRCYKNKKGLETTCEFLFENEFNYNFQDFNNSNANIYSIHAIVPSQVLVISKYDLEFLYIHISKIQKIGREIAEAQTNVAGKRIKSYLNFSSEERYKFLLIEKPTLLKHVPLKYIASYLGITIQHLSRIRKLH